MRLRLIVAGAAAAIAAALVAGYLSVSRESAPARPSHTWQSSVLHGVGAARGDSAATIAGPGVREATPRIDNLDAVLATLDADLGEEGVPIGRRDLEAALQGDPELQSAMSSLPAAEQFDAQEESWSD